MAGAAVTSARRARGPYIPTKAGVHFSGKCSGALPDQADHEVGWAVAGKRSRFDTCRISFRKTGVHFSGKCSKVCNAFPFRLTPAKVSTMALSSMTGFARADGVCGTYVW